MLIAYYQLEGCCWIMNQKSCGRSQSVLGIDWFCSIMLSTFSITYREGVMSDTIFVVILLKSMEMWHLTNIQFGSVTCEAAVNITPNTTHFLVRLFSCCVLIGQKLLCHSWQGIAQLVVCWVLTFFNESGEWYAGSFNCLCLLGFVSFWWFTHCFLVMLSFDMVHI